MTPCMRSLLSHDDFFDTDLPCMYVFLSCSHVHDKWPPVCDHYSPTMMSSTQIAPCMYVLLFCNHAYHKWPPVCDNNSPMMSSTQISPVCTYFSTVTISTTNDPLSLIITLPRLCHRHNSPHPPVCTYYSPVTMPMTNYLLYVIITLPWWCPWHKSSMYYVFVHCNHVHDKWPPVCDHYSLTILSSTQITPLYVRITLM